MNAICILIAWTSFALVPTQQTQPVVPKGEHDISGIWISEGENGKGLVEIYQADDGKFYGKLLEVFDEKKQAALNSAMEKYKKTELLVLQDFEFVGKNEWKNGYVISPKRKRKLSGKLLLKNNNELEVTGEWGFYSKTFTWIRK